jgi:hypothetical protein
MAISPHEVHVLDQLEAAYHDILLPSPPHRSSWLSGLSKAIGWILSRMVCPDFTLITPVLVSVFPVTTLPVRQRTQQQSDHPRDSHALRHGSEWEGL